MKLDEFNLDRFLDAQEHSYGTALTELRAGKKRSHWIWYIFPQLRGLGVSPTSHTYGVASLKETHAYLDHPVLGLRLREAIKLVLDQKNPNAEDVLGELDALKFKSCLTLFSLAAPSERIFSDALERFFSGERDIQTLKLLKIT
ncbi:MAG: calpastatin [Cellvibrio sp. 79]|nr:MAG: calpastatin [Cellvibrio sp. 79]